MDPKKSIWSWKEILESEISEPPALVDKLVYEMDNCIILGDAKTGKSLFTMQLAMSLSSGETFLDSMPVTKPCKVIYVQAEGKMYETIPRGKKMSKEVPFKSENLKWIYLPTFPMDRPDSCELFFQKVGDFNPDVIIFDPLYKLASSGSLTKDDVANAITNNLDIIKVHYSSAIILNHHQHRPQHSKNSGTVVNMSGDQSIFGSFVWRAWPDNIILFEGVPKHQHMRKITCDTQRSATLIPEMNVVLVQPDPLYWELLEDMTATDHMILQLIKKNTVMTWEQIAEVSGLAKSTIHKSLRNLKKQKKIKHLEEQGTYGLCL